jgi:formamidopyrimidine-DNA glycosylase
MPELPEIASRTEEMNRELTGKVIQNIEIIQPKCLNLPVDEFVQRLLGAKFEQFHYRGKWIEGRTDKGWLMINMGMGGELLLTDRSQLPEKYRLIFDFTDAACLTINFWWFGYVHFVDLDALGSHTLTAKLGINALDLGEDDFRTLLNAQKGRVKAFLLDQTKIAGIGNAYIHDILFLAKIHPLRTLSSLHENEVRALYLGIQKGLRTSLEKGGAFYESSLHGQKGGFLMEDILIGYREGQPCPVCGTPIQKIKTGSTSSFICPNCQREQ